MLKTFIHTLLTIYFGCYTPKAVQATGSHCNMGCKALIWMKPYARGLQAREKEKKKKRKAKEGKILEWWRGDKVSGNLQASEAGLSQVANTSEVKLPQGRAISTKLMGLEL